MTTAHDADRKVVTHHVTMLTDGASLRVDLSWATDDPHVVLLSVHPGPPDQLPTDWVLDRIQLAGVVFGAPAAAAGEPEADIHLRRQIAGPFTEITLQPPRTTPLTLISPCAALVGFLRATYRHAPLDVRMDIPPYLPADWTEGAA